MELLKPGRMPFGGSDLVFRHSPARVIAGATMLIATVALAFALHWPPAWFLSAIAIVILLGLRRAIVARLRPTNWLVRMTDDGMLIHFRNYLNFHLPEDMPTMAYIRYAEIERAHRAKVKWQVGDGRSNTMHKRDLVELVLRAEQPELAAALAAERGLKPPREPRWYGTSTTRYGGHPVRLAGMRRLQIEWYVQPPANRFLEALRARGVQIDEPVTVDLKDNKSDREKLLIELVESGRRIEAMKLARAIYGFNLMEARTFVDGMTDQGADSVSP